ncbi:hypothetical protein ACFVH6_17515 [Spirillospora sp. NPDC127200]
MDLIRSWATAVVVYLIAGVVTAATAVNTGAIAQEVSGNGALLWNAVPAAATFLLMTVLGRLLHPAPDRHRPVRHAVAALAVPVLLMVGGLVSGIVQGDAAEAAVSLAGALPGTAAGWGLGALARLRGTSAA